MKIKESKIYIADDGKEFTTEKECAEYEKELASYQLWSVTHSPDCTEGRGYHGKTYLRTKSAHKEEVEDFCFDHFGRKSAYVQGVSFMPAWRLTLVEDKDHEMVGSTFGLSCGGFKELKLRFEGRINRKLVIAK